jgi:hypothetical protein
MRFSHCAALLLGIGLIGICSCEKHRVGEMPEVQRENVDVEKPGGEAMEGKDKNEAMAPHSPKNSPSPTPAEFFPSKP